MISNFVFRNLKKRPFLNLIKVVGLALGLSGILFISLFLKNELAYDSWHSKADRIYRYTTTHPNFLKEAHFARVHNPNEIPQLKEYFPEVETFVRMSPIKGGVILHNRKFYDLNAGFVCDSTFFDVFDAQLKVGDKSSIFNNPNALVITNSFAQKVFGGENPIGKQLSIPSGQYYAEQIDFTVQGIMNDFPQNSHFHPDFIASATTTQLNNGWAYCYLLLSPKANPQNIISGFNNFISSNNDLPENFSFPKIYLQKITDIHLKSDKLREIESNGNMTNVYVLSIAALVLLLISLSNFVSLNTGMSGFNFKFININRILGSGRNTRFRYFAIESFYIVIISVVAMLAISIPANVLINKHFEINLFENNLLFVIGIVLGFCIVGILSGLQPAINQNLRNTSGQNANLIHKNIFVSKGIIITQYSLAIILLVAVLAIKRQTRFALNNSMGDNKSNVLIMENMHANVQTKFEVFKEELLKYNSIESVSGMLEPPGGEANDRFRYNLEGAPEVEDETPNMIGVFPCDYSFANVFDLNFLSGQNFSKKNDDVDGSAEYIINEAAMKQMGITSAEEAVGKSFQLIYHNQYIKIPKGKIIGVVKDFHLSSMKKEVNPLVLFKRKYMWLLNFAIAYPSGMKEQAVADIEKVWNEIYPGYQFHYEHIGAMYQKVYKTELLQAKLLTLFTIISLFISSMGLLGISLLVSQQRVKEIGIRKVNGASISEILQLLNKGFVRWIIIAFLLATPIAYYAMNKWLENFAYKTNLSWWIFALAGVLALGIALLTVSIQSWKAATRNPVEALRYE